MLLSHEKRAAIWVPVWMRLARCGGGGAGARGGGGEGPGCRGELRLGGGGQGREEELAWAKGKAPPRVGPGRRGATGLQAGQRAMGGAR